MSWKDVGLIATRDSGETFDYNSGDWRIPEDGLDGVDSLPVEFYTANKGFGQGDILTGTRLMSREITIKAHTRKKGSDLRTLRTNYLSFHRPVSNAGTAHTYTLEITYMGKTAYAYGCICKSYSNPTDNLYKNDTITVIYECLDPFLYNSDGEKVGAL